MMTFKVLRILSHHLLSEILKQIMTIPEILSQVKMQRANDNGCPNPTPNLKAQGKPWRGGRKPLRGRGPKHLL